MAGVEQGNFNNEGFIEEVSMSASAIVTLKTSKTKIKCRGEIEFLGGGGLGQIPQRKTCVCLLSEAIEKGSLWIGARCAKRISKLVDKKKE